MKDYVTKYEDQSTPRYDKTTKYKNRLPLNLANESCLCKIKTHSSNNYAEFDIPE